ncbi:glycerate kinase [uncultured Friedmanniella sp.]|uniref:glycerate kinase n=1 Tax=uncultured Friedmanniella sp. TaxID=335381 RepID=UPI0035CC45A7
MRVLVVSDAVGAMSSLQAGSALAEGWPRAQVVVTPVGVAGAGFARATADSWGAPLQTSVGEGVVVTAAVASGRAVLRVERASTPLPGLPLTAGSGPLGEALSTLLARGPLRQVHLDLTGLAVHDGGAGLLAALGATADVSLTDGVRGLSGLQRLDVGPARELLAGVDLVGVVPADELGQPLLGLRGITSRHGRTAGLDAEVLLRTDADLERLARLAAPEQASAPGAGACGGLGLAVLALGGRLSTGPALGLAAGPLGDGRSAPDLVVTGCGVFDFAARGGGVVTEVAHRAGEALRPCILVAGEVLVGAREMRTIGIEAAYAVREATGDAPVDGDFGATELAVTARRVGRSWSW